MSEFAVSFATCAQFQLLDIRALHSRSCSQPPAPRLGPKKPRAFCATSSSSRTAHYQECRKAGRTCNSICGTSISSTVSTRNGDRSVACDRSFCHRRNRRPLVVHRVPRSSVVGRFLVVNLGTPNRLPRRPLPGRCNISARPCHFTHLFQVASQGIQPHQRSHDVVVIVTATCPHHHLIVAAFGKFCVS